MKNKNFTEYEDEIIKNRPGKFRRDIFLRGHSINLANHTIYKKLK